MLKINQYVQIFNMNNSKGHNRMKLWAVSSTQDNMNKSISKMTYFSSHTELKMKTKNTIVPSPLDSYILEVKETPLN